MKVQLIEMEPQLKDKSEATAKLMKNLTKEKAQADEVRQVVVNDEAIVKVCISLSNKHKRNLHLRLGFRLVLISFTGLKRRKEILCKHKVIL